MKLSALPSLLRIHNTIFGAFTVATSVFLLQPSNMITVFLSGITAYILLASAGNVVNDIFDVKIDRINRPERPIPSGDVTKKEAQGVYTILVISGLGASLYSSFIRNTSLPFIVASLFVGIGVLYSAKLKLMGLIGNVTVGISFSIGYIYGLIISTLEPSLVKLTYVVLFFVTATSLLISREIIKGIEDIEGDKERGVKTLARTRGIKKSALISVFFAFLAIVSYTTLLFVGIMGKRLTPFVIAGDASAAISAILILFGRDYAHKSSLFSKIAMFIGLVGFFLISLFQSGVLSI
ncbi:MAG: hypothetical protein GWO20_00145 [Candidatus Korarchaeota archaeon]|nr:hypothetical protein [Candidatus Korarchaeota archaeon]NIU81958.1 hypothetical protein [Candidatus Thorarchaeota archaeon]NIW12408.1 hypothetical protein [Candidatus Thorarchaeota archaeon]NIW50629.1 hypothetical protein [Candidatus Korarchaeota archaeon]